MSVLFLIRSPDQLFCGSNIIIGRTTEGNILDGDEEDCNGDGDNGDGGVYDSVCKSKRAMKKLRKIERIVPIFKRALHYVEKLCAELAGLRCDVR